ncbi:hypothetical protein [Pseudodonghicola flavimaris]|uniref:Uncharacterized protein n=1 Tax=Pseudodonghicola flavimaris TaxID=3050036 RepID=A0ABT7F517_9RHOB|nr:hypothetical protein [Pseudodonghicola flavimaris]MDK3019691.1 hypothetical protein [Pseudodonghicola flavimaris]
MFLELIAVIVAGIAVAGLMLLIRRLSGGRLPGWLVPAAAGAAMIVVTIASEYGWYARTRATLPEGVEVIDEVESRAAYRPWTYLVPMVERFAALDRAGLRQNPARPGVFLVDLYLFARWSAPKWVTVAVDCQGGRQALLTADADFGPDGDITGAAWQQMDPEDPLAAALCNGGT